LGLSTRETLQPNFRQAGSLVYFKKYLGKLGSDFTRVSRRGAGSEDLGDARKILKEKLAAYHTQVLKERGRI